MNYYLFCLIIGVITTIIYHLYNKKNGLIIRQQDYIKFFIYSSLVSLASIYFYLKVNKLDTECANSLQVLTGSPDF